MYSIKAVSKATGLSVETLRAWERRYAIVSPLRDESGRRVYRPQDVLRLRKLKEGTERGHPISRLATLDEPGLEVLQSTDGVEGGFRVDHFEQAAAFDGLCVV